MLVREANAGDLDSMLALECEAGTAAHWSRQSYAAIFQPDAVPRKALVLHKDGTLLGFVVALAAGPEWEIENIVVHGTARKQGVGTSLIGELLQRARIAGAEAVCLEVRESNAAARALYEKNGFFSNGLRSSYYSEPTENAVLYRYCFAAAQQPFKPVDFR